MFSIVLECTVHGLYLNKVNLHLIMPFLCQAFHVFKVLDHAGNTAKLLPVQFSSGGLVRSTEF